MKHQQIYDRILVGILEGKYPPGKQIPTENELAEMFHASRPTVGRALRELEQKGLIYRRRGAGTFVRKPTQAQGQKIGVLVPGVSLNSGELFSTMVSQMSREASEREYVLLLNDSPTGSEEQIIEQAKKICQQIIDLQVSGVFFMPMELSPEKWHINNEIAEAFDNAGIAVALLDRDVCVSPERSKFDLVGVNNERGAYILAEHLIENGCRKIDFLTHVTISSAINDRITGYQNALIKYDIQPDHKRVHHLDISPSHNVRNEDVEEHIDMIMNNFKPDAIICINDRMAAMAMRCLINLGYNIPDDVALVGFDDLPFLSYLPVPLTTIRQPAKSLAREGVRTILDRMKEPDLPARDIIVATELVIRESCGAKKKKSANQSPSTSEPVGADK